MADLAMKGADKTGNYLAKPPQDCCRNGSIHFGEPRGMFETLAGFNTYLARPPDHKANGNILFYFGDVWGFFNNAFLLMDSFADAGYLVLGIDYFRGVSQALALQIIPTPFQAEA